MNPDGYFVIIYHDCEGFYLYLSLNFILREYEVSINADCMEMNPQCLAFASIRQNQERLLEKPLSYKSDILDTTDILPYHQVCQKLVFILLPKTTY